MEISNERLEELESKERFLNILNDNGLHRWVHYEKSRDIFKNIENDEHWESIIDVLIDSIVEPDGIGSGFDITYEGEDKARVIFDRYIKSL